MSATCVRVSKLIAIGVTLLVGTLMLEGCSDSDSEVPAPRTRKRGSYILGCDIYLGEKSPFTVATYESSGSGNFTLVSATCGESNRAAQLLSNNSSSNRVRVVEDCEELQGQEREEFQAEKALSSLYRECTELKNASLVGPPICKVTLTSASDPPQKVDMQYEDPNVFVATATTCSDGSTAPLPAGANVTAGIACKDLKKKAEIAETFEKFMEEVTGKTFQNPCRSSSSETPRMDRTEKPQASLNDGTLTYRTVSIYVRDFDLSRSESPSFAQLGRSEREIRMRT
ncbi:hypothetical protein FOZ63_034154 [Perkinsus olseni]|uniref:Uncharacterized protein n=1 Tax=Perkinsus olseni TaxID=32597 RepID=A0A7J6QFX3_PEROL|nr:hypothetical protein FOZ63_034154 [Perkinsus olseni]